jgi:hypothetical protein
MCYVYVPSLYECVTLAVKLTQNISTYNFADMSFSFESGILIALLGVDADLSARGVLLFVCLMKGNEFTWTPISVVVLAVQILLAFGWHVFILMIVTDLSEIKTLG